MKIIDARSGEEMKLHETISYGDGEGITLLDFRPGVLRASFLVKGSYLDPRDKRLRTIVQWVQGPVRYLHPGFPFQRVAFFPS